MLTQPNLQRKLYREERVMDKSNNSLPLKVNNLTKRFHQGQRTIEAVKNASLTVEKGNFVAIMGPSGSGKSTLLHLIAGLTTPDGGRIEVDGQDLSQMSDNQLTKFRRRHIGLVFQAYNLVPTLTARDNIMLPMVLSGRASDAGGQADALIEELELGHVRDQRPDTMSGGEQQRVVIGRALIANPSIILADEPTGNLDSIGGQKICGLMKSLCDTQDRTLLMVTHEAQVAVWAKRVVVMKDGQLIDSFDADAIEDVHALMDLYHYALSRPSAI
jgi:putative ABC transport system ATP-binding protein